MKLYDAIVVGGGPAGLTAVLYLCRSGLSVAQVEMLAPGGQILKTESIENYPGFPQGVKGWELADTFAAHLAEYPFDRYNDAVLKMEQSAHGWTLSIGKDTIEGKTVVICSGANPRPLGVPREVQLTGRGVSYCALCDGNFFRDQVVAVVGGSSILYSDVEAYADELVQQRREMGYTSDRDPMNEALEALLQQKLLYNQALIDSVDINSGEVSARIEAYLQSLIEGGIANLEAKEHMAVFNYREMLRQRYEEQFYAQTMQGQVVGKVTVVPGEVERFYNSIDKDSLPIIGEQYVYAQITKFPASLSEAKQRTKEPLLDMRERVITGKTKFSVLARMYSVDMQCCHNCKEPIPERLWRELNKIK